MPGHGTPPTRPGEWRRSGSVAAPNPRPHPRRSGRMPLRRAPPDAGGDACFFAAAALHGRQFVHERSRTSSMRSGEGRMKICFIMYQGNMYSGGQGVYLHYMTRELVKLGHEVHVISGRPYPRVAEGVIHQKLHYVQLLGVSRRPRRARVRPRERRRRSFIRGTSTSSRRHARRSHRCSLPSACARTNKLARNRARRPGRSTSCTTTRRSATASSR